MHVSQCCTEYFYKIIFVLVVCVWVCTFAPVQNLIYHGASIRSLPTILKCSMDQTIHVAEIKELFLVPECRSDAEREMQQDKFILELKQKFEVLEERSENVFLLLILHSDSYLVKNFRMEIVLRLSC